MFWPSFGHYLLLAVLARYLALECCINQLARMGGLERVVLSGPCQPHPADGVQKLISSSELVLVADGLFVMPGRAKDG